MTKPINRYIDLSNIPHQLKGTHINYRWKDAIGCTCDFRFGKVSGIIEITNAFRKGNAWYLTINYQDKEYDIHSSSLKQVCFNNFLFPDGPPFKFEVGHTFVDNKRDFTILDREFREYITTSNHKINQKFYLVHCNKCGYEEWKKEIFIDGCYKTGCPGCAGLRCVIGKNDIPTVAKWMVKYFPGGKEQASQYTKCSTQKVEFICPDCGRKRIASPRNITIIGKLACPCQDSMSYPNKFLYSFFEQLGVNFISEKSFDWSCSKVYDNYVEFKNGESLICENHGEWHYKEKVMESRGLTEIQENDRFKRRLAKNNSITYYVELDCRKSEKEWIQNSIEHSILADLFDLSKVDYDKCDIFAHGNIMKIVCDYKKENPELFVAEIAEHFHLNKANVRVYLKRGTKLGWCEYDPSSENVRKSHSTKGKSKRSIPITCIELNKYYRDTETFIEERSHVGEKYTASCILDVCRGKQSHHHNFHFEFISKEEFNRIKSESPEKAVGEYFKLAS